MIGNKDLDYEILYKLNDYDLGNMCRINQYTRELCKNDTFWMNRTIRRFFPVFQSVDKIKEFKGDSSWRNYYIDLINFMETFYKITTFITREDHKKLKEYIRERTNKYIICYQKSFDCSLNWMNEDFIDLNYLFESIMEFYEMKETNVDEDKKKEEILDFFIKTFFQISHFNINERSAMFFIDNYGKEGIQILLKYKNNSRTRKIIMKEILLDNDSYNETDILPYVETFQEILSVLYDTIRLYNLNENRIKKFLDEAIKRGAKKKDFIKEKKEKRGKRDKYKYEKNLEIIEKILRERNILRTEGLKERIKRRTEGSKERIKR